MSLVEKTVEILRNKLKVINDSKISDDIFPDSVKKAVEALEKCLGSEDKKRIKKCTKEELVSLHHSLGRFIRNTFGLWGSNEKLLNDCKKSHPDDASMVIIEHLWKKLNGKL